MKVLGIYIELNIRMWIIQLKQKVFLMGSLKKAM